MQPAEYSTYKMLQLKQLFKTKVQARGLRKLQRIIHLIRKKDWSHGDKNSGVSFICISTSLETRTNGNPEVWMMLKNCIEEDAETAKMLIETAEMKMP